MGSPLEIPRLWTKAAVCSLEGAVDKAIRAGSGRVPGQACRDGPEGWGPGKGRNAKSLLRGDSGIGEEKEDERHTSTSCWSVILAGVSVMASP